MVTRARGVPPAAVFDSWARWFWGSWFEISLSVCLLSVPGGSRAADPPFTWERRKGRLSDPPPATHHISDSQQANCQQTASKGDRRDPTTATTTPSETRKLPANCPQANCQQMRPTRRDDGDNDAVSDTMRRGLRMRLMTAAAPRRRRGARAAGVSYAFV